MMKIQSAEFVTGAVTPKQYPKTFLPEVAFAGRSNVGKSSLLNSILNRKKLVKTSATPGKTQEINFFEINRRWMFTDLPGYGFARAPANVRRKWQGMIEQYLTGREPLRLVVLLVDIRRDPTELDLQMQEWLEHWGIPYLLVATKADKLKRGAAQNALLNAGTGAPVEKDQERIRPGRPAGGDRLLLPGQLGPEGALGPHPECACGRPGTGPGKDRVNAVIPTSRPESPAVPLFSR